MDNSQWEMEWIDVGLWEIQSDYTSNYLIKIKSFLIR